MWCKIGMTDKEKDKLWCDYMVTQLVLNLTHFKENPIHIVGIEYFHREVEDFHYLPAEHMNFQAWNWKWGDRVFSKENIYVMIS
jgi:hypothetical protein